MKLIGAFSTELLSMFKINTASSVSDVVKDFIAFVIIAEIANIIAQTVKSTDKQDSLNNQDIKFDKKLENKSLFQHSEEFMGRINKGNWEGIMVFLATLLYKLVNTIYITFYYYFFPLLAIFLLFDNEKKSYEINTVDLWEISSMNDNI